MRTIEKFDYELNINVKQKRPLIPNSEKFYKADWIPKREDSPIILILTNDEKGKREASFYMELNSRRHIVLTYGFVKNDRYPIMLLQERAPHGSLERVLQNGEFEPSQEVLITIFQQIIDAMIHMTNKGVVHCDLRCANVLVFEIDAVDSKRNLVKLTNFSMARKISEDSPVSSNRLPENLVRYCAPEILKSDDESSYSESSDVYSMGVLMWQACSKGAIPYERCTDIRQRSLNGDKLSKPNACQGDLWNVICDCFHTQPELRYSFQQMRERLKRVKPT